MRLDQGGVNIAGGGHLCGDGEADGSHSLLGRYPPGVNDFGVVLKADKDASAGIGGYRKFGGITHLVVLAVGLKAQQGGPGVAPAGSSGPAGPVDVNDLPGGMAGDRVCSPDVVAAPFGVVNLHLPLALTVHCVDAGLLYPVAVARGEVAANI